MPGMELPRPKNRLLAALAPDVYARMTLHLEHLEMKQRQMLFGYDSPIERVYFPETMVGSIVQPMQDGSAVEAATIGFEGIIGLQVYLGVLSASAQAFVQVSGATLAMSADRFREFRDEPSVRDVLGRYTTAFLTQISQSAACNGVHNVRQRCARWLLHTHDRTEGDTFGLTQEFLAQMLGVRRATVTEVAAALQAAGLIEYHYGHVTVSDRDGLERASCECYRVIRREYARLIERRQEPDPLASQPMQRDGLSTLHAPRASGETAEEVG